MCDISINIHIIIKKQQNTATAVQDMGTEANQRTNKRTNEQTRWVMNERTNEPSEKHKQWLNRRQPEAIPLGKLWNKRRGACIFVYLPCLHGAFFHSLRLSSSLSLSLSHPLSMCKCVCFACLVFVWTAFDCCVLVSRCYSMSLLPTWYYVQTQPWNGIQKKIYKTKIIRWHFNFPLFSWRNCSVYTSVEMRFSCENTLKTLV